MPCPECEAENRLCIRNGFVYRKTTVIDGTAGARVQRYQCTKCGHHFTSPEMDIAKSPTEADIERFAAEGEKLVEGLTKFVSRHKPDGSILTGTVSTIAIECDRILLGIAGIPDYHVIANTDDAVAVGDVVEYTPDTVHLGWFTAVMQKGVL